MNLAQCSCPRIGGVCPYQVPFRAWPFAKAWDRPRPPRRVETLARLVRPLGPDDYQLPRIGTQLRTLYELLRDRGALRNRQIVEITGWDAHVVGSRLSALRRRRLVASKGRPHFLLFAALSVKLME